MEQGGAGWHGSLGFGAAPSQAVLLVARRLVVVSIFIVPSIRHLPRTASAPRARACAGTVQQEVALLKEVMSGLRSLRDKQALLASYQAQLVHMRRAGLAVQ